MTIEQPKSPKSEQAGAPPADGAGKPAMPEKPAITQTQPPGEVNGPKGPEPTRYGDWERKGIASDF